jgi:hypothetical protein
MSNPGPNIVTPDIQRGQAVLTVSLTPASVGAATSAEQTFTVSGLAVGDFVSVNGSTGNASAIAGARVSAANTLAIRFINPTAGALTPGAGSYLVYVARSYPVMSDFGVTAFNNVGPVAGTNP